MGLTREQILAAEDIKLEKVEVPEWGGEVYLRPMTGADLDAYEDEMAKRSKGDGKFDLAGFRAWYLSLVLVDTEGVRMFAQEGDVAALGKKSGKVVNRLFAEAQRVNGLTAEAVTDAKKD